jgi:hypothetical protein
VWFSVVWVEGSGVGECGPLTPDPSPPFHGGEGRISCQLSVVSGRRADCSGQCGSGVVPLR